MVFRFFKLKRNFDFASLLVLGSLACSSPTFAMEDSLDITFDKAKRASELFHSCCSRENFANAKTALKSCIRRIKQEGLRIEGDDEDEKNKKILSNLHNAIDAKFLLASVYERASCELSGGYLPSKEKNLRKAVAMHITLAEELGYQEAAGRRLEAIEFYQNNPLPLTLNTSIEELKTSAAERPSYLPILHDYALAYMEGNAEIEQDVETGIDLLLHGSSLGYAAIQNELGGIYKEGRYGIPVDSTKAFSFFKLAAEQEDEDALYVLATLYRDGVGVQKNLAAAAKLFKESTILMGTLSPAAQNFFSFSLDEEEEEK